MGNALRARRPWKFQINEANATNPDWSYMLGMERPVTVATAIALAAWFEGKPNSLPQLGTRTRVSIDLIAWGELFRKKASKHA
jgi:hypothetical protein